MFVCGAQDDEYYLMLGTYSGDIKLIDVQHWEVSSLPLIPLTRVDDPGLFLATCLDCSLLVRAPDSGSKGCELESRRERWENFLLQSQLCVLTLICCSFHPCVTMVACKELDQSVKSAVGRLHLNTHTL